MGARYVVSKAATAMVAATDILTITAPAGRSLKIWAITVSGGGTASAANEVGLFRSTGGVTPVATTPAPIAADSPASLFTAATGWTTQPTAGVVIDRAGVNSNGAYINNKLPPGMEIDIPGGGQVSLRPVSGTGIVTASILVEQVG
jgi:hypothetical protein